MRWRLAVWLMRGAKVHGARQLLGRSLERRPARAGQLPRDESYPAFLVAKWKIARRTLIPKDQEEVDREVARIAAPPRGRASLRCAVEAGYRLKAARRRSDRISDRIRSRRGSDERSTWSMAAA